MPLFGSSGDGGAAQQEAQRQATISSGEQKIDQNFSQFDPSFFSNYKNAIVGAQEPQLDQQYQTTGKNLTYALARGGNLNSSAAQQEGQSLNNELGIQQSNLANKAQDATNQLQANIESQKGNLTNQLVASQDVSSTAESAAAAAAADRAPSVIQPLGNLFSDWSSEYLAGKTAQAFQNGGGNAWSGLLNQGYGTV
jgi:hypothetical protein